MDRLCKVMWRGVVMGLVMALWSAAALAQSNPSPESCSGVGMIDVQCCNCATGEYMGKINVQAAYDEWNKGCLPSKDQARGRCSGGYGIPLNDVGMKWKYKLGMTEWKNWNPRNGCPCAEW
ncbi:MAG: hypothetical protein ACOCVM_00305 [Desulfovibrionaceae bacterium]